MCPLHLTHPSAHTPRGVSPGSSWGSSALLKGLTSVVDNSCRSRDLNPQPWVTSLSIRTTTAPCSSMDWIDSYTYGWIIGRGSIISIIQDTGLCVSVLASLCTELVRLLTNCDLLLISNYMTKIVLSNIIHYITNFRQYNQITFRLLLT